MKLTVFYPVWKCVAGKNAGTVLLLMCQGSPAAWAARNWHKYFGALLEQRYALVPHGVMALEYEGSQMEGSGRFSGQAHYPHRVGMTPFGVAAILEGPALVGKLADGTSYPDERILDNEEFARRMGVSLPQPMSPEAEALFLSGFDANGKPATRH